jgi:hypothetical protein
MENRSGQPYINRTFVKSTTQQMSAEIQMLLKVFEEKEIDSFLLFATVAGMHRLSHLEELLMLAAQQHGVTVEELIASYRRLFYGTKKEGKLGVYKVRSSNIVSWGHSKKKEVLLLYLKGVEMEYPHTPTLIQVIFAGNDMYSGARTHRIFKNPQDAIVMCQSMLCDANPPLSIMEVPNKIQGTGKFYIDWDMTIDKLMFIEGTLLERVIQARDLALAAPAKICEIFVELGYISADTDIQIVIKEGSRPKVGCTTIHKISFHFIYNIFGTTAQMTSAWKGLFTYLENHGGTLSSILHGSGEPINDIQGMHGYGSLIGIDLHPYSNPEQGLAMGFSRKHLLDPYTRFIEILHVTNGIQTRSEIPCNHIWIGRTLPVHIHPRDIRYVLSKVIVQSSILKTNPGITAP